MDGFINLDKPIGPTSFKMVDKARKLTGQKKVGHTGTLDPGASGVLPLCVGRATKLAVFLVDSNKTYRAEITFGITTDTQDRYGRILRTKKAEMDRKRLEEMLRQFRGPIMQLPPMYSAVRQGGKKLYELAREGLEVERKSRKIEVYRLDLADYLPPDRAVIEVECSKGTYIRTLCNDIGEKLGCGAIMSSLTRLSVGDFSLDSAVTLKELEEAAKDGNWAKYLLPIDYPLKHMPKVFIRDKYVKLALNGNNLYDHNLLTNNKEFNHLQQLRLYYRSTFLGIYSYHSDTQPSYFRANRLLADGVEVKQYS
jgi:tRNA pseudouridine55 synthase